MVEFIKFEKPEQFPIDEILNENERLVRSWASVEVKDNQGDIVPISEIRKVLNIWMKRGAPISDNHTNKIIGKGLNWKEDTEPMTNKPAIMIDYQVFTDYTHDDDVWEQIKNGERTGLSIGGKRTKKATLIKDDYSDSMANQLMGIELFEIASAFKPANQFSRNIAVNFMAKSDDSTELEKDLKKGAAVIDIMKPFVGFENFEECIQAQKNRGHTEESSQRICGFLKNKFEKIEKEDNKIKTEPSLKKEDELELGKKIEMEHKDTIDTFRKEIENGENITDEQIAEMIANDHLKEDPEYYTKLKQMESGNMNNNIDKARVYLQPGQQAPEGVNVQQGARGGKFYENKPKEQDNQKPQQKEKPMSEQEHKYNFKTGETVLDSTGPVKIIKIGKYKDLKEYDYKNDLANTSDDENIEDSDVVLVDAGDGVPYLNFINDIEKWNSDNVNQNNKKPEGFNYDQKRGYVTGKDSQNKTFTIGSKVKVDPDLLSSGTDPYNKSGESGDVVSIKDDVVIIQFKDGSYGKYEQDTLLRESNNLNENKSMDTQNNLIKKDEEVNMEIKKEETIVQPMEENNEENTLKLLVEKLDKLILLIESKEATTMKAEKKDEPEEDKEKEKEMEEEEIKPKDKQEPKEETMKSLNFVKATTPRTKIEDISPELQKSENNNNVNTAYEMILKAKNGKLDMAKAKRDIIEQQVKERNEVIEKIINKN